MDKWGQNRPALKPGATGDCRPFCAQVSPVSRAPVPSVVVGKSDARRPTPTASEALSGLAKARQTLAHRSYSQFVRNQSLGPDLLLQWVARGRPFEVSG